MSDQSNDQNKRPAMYAQLTERELEVLNLVRQNKTNQQISEILAVTLRTIENHISRLYVKTGCRGRLELANLKKRALTIK